MLRRVTVAYGLFTFSSQSGSFYCDFVAWYRNYRSAEDLHDKVLECLEEDLCLGVVEGGYSWKDLCIRLRFPAGTPEPGKSVLNL